MAKVTANSYLALSSQTLESPLWGSWWLESRLSRVMPSADPCPLLTPAGWGPGTLASVLSVQVCPWQPECTAGDKLEAE